MPQSLEEKKKNRLDELYEYGRSKGTITYKEIMDRLVELEMDSDQLDRVLETLEAYGVNVINDNADRQVILTDEQAADQAAEAARIGGEDNAQIERRLCLSDPSGQIDIGVILREGHIQPFFQDCHQHAHTVCVRAC